MLKFKAYKGRVITFLGTYIIVRRRILSSRGYDGLGERRSLSD